MKKVLLFLSCLALFACSESGNDEPAPKPVEQEVSCRITAPEEGFTCYLDEELTIQGEGSVNVGEIESVRLKLNGLVVAELESVPFTYKHTFQPSDKAGEYTLTLTIEGDQGTIKSDSRRITLKERENPTPDPDQEVSCALTAPENGARYNAGESFTIRGEGEVNVGEIKEVVLRINDMRIEEVNALPFVFTYTFSEEAEAGEYTITLSVKGDQGAEATASRVVTLLEKSNPEPDQEVSCTLTAPENGARYNAGESFTIRGEGEVNVGKIEEVVLRINDTRIEEVNALPFAFTYTFSEEAEAGEYTITLSVKGDQGAEATASRVVTLLEKSNPDPDQEVSCALTAPENGARYNAGESFTIRGEGEVNVGKIEEVVLRINDTRIEEVNALPFAFTYTFSEEAEAGEYTITLSVKGDQGAEATASRVVTLLEKSNPDPLPDNGEQIDPTPGNDFGEF